MFTEKAIRSRTKHQTKLLKITVIFATFFFLSACANKDPVSEETLPDSTLINQVDTQSASESSLESGNHPVVTDPPLNDCSVKIGDVSLSLSESRQDILAKLEAAGFEYSEVHPDSPDEVGYDRYYNAAGCLQIYFLDDTCVRIRLQESDSSIPNPQTARGLYSGDTYSQMIDLYGDDYETHAYSYKGIYTIYRYSIGDCICEFGIAGENRDSFYNIDIYLPSQLPIYEYGEEILESEAEELLDAFLAGEIPAIYDNGEESVIMFDRLPVDAEDYFSYSVGERIDLDNDGENEQIVNGPYGGIYFDARDGKVYVLAEGNGTAWVLSYANYDDAVWIVHSDTTHAGRQMYWLSKYDGEGNMADEFQLSAEYWDSPDGRYDENSNFTCRGENISMEEYEALRKEILGW